MGKTGKSNKNRLRVHRVVDVPLREVSGICLRRGRNGRMFLIAVGDRVAKIAWFSQPAVHPGQREEEHVESVVARWRGASTFKQSSSRDAAPAHSLLKDNVQLQASDRPASDRLSILRKSIGNNTGVTPRRTV
jgi:hypothetical protein